MKYLLMFSCSLLICACSSQKTTSPKAVISDAVTTPLVDLNLVRTAIPNALKVAQQNPYAAPREQTCDSIAADIQALNSALGSDLDTPIAKKNDSLIVRGVESVEKESVSAIRKTTEAALPFRNWVRELSGAARNSQTVNSAIAAGGIRRAYLKGIGQAMQCQPPAAPLAMNTAPSPEAK